MLFGRRSASVAAPAPNPPQPDGNGVTTASGEEQLAHLRKQLVARDPTLELEHELARLADEIVWLKQRYGTLQNRVTSELREIRREVDRYREELSDDEYDEDQG